MYYQFTQSFPMLEIFIKHLNIFIKLLTVFRADNTFWLWLFFFHFSYFSATLSVSLENVPFCVHFLSAEFFSVITRSILGTGSKQGYEQISHGINP